MTALEKQRQLVEYRIIQAEESLSEARYLLEGGKTPRSIINRAYYSMFYAILALLIFEKYSSSKHSGVLAYFNKRFIKEKVFSEELGKAVNKAFELRQMGDYREYTKLTIEQVEPYISYADHFIREIKKYLRGRNLFPADSTV